MNELHRIREALHRHIGFDTDTLGDVVVSNAVRRRLEALGLEDVSKYADTLLTDYAEIERLTDDLLVPETWFFRDAKPFEHLGDWYVRNRSAGPERKVRTLSAGCSTGEEAYSIAAALLLAGAPVEYVSVVGVDVSESVLEIARAGEYKYHVPRPEFSLQYRKYVRVGEGGVMRVSDELKSCVSFRRENLTSDDLLSRTLPFDVIFCRNLMIYQTAGVRERLQRRLHRLLAPDGLFIVGHAEPLRVSEKMFAADGLADAFAFRKAEKDASSGKQDAAVRPGARNTSTQRPAINWGGPAGAGERIRETLLERAERLADAGVLSEAEEFCRKSLEEDRHSADAYYLLGAITQARGQIEEAETCFHKAVYLDGQHEKALRQLALLAEGKGNWKSAGFLHRRVRKATE